MPGPQLPRLDLTLDERRDLTALVRRHTAPQQLVLRARIILLAADGLNNSQIARTLGLEADTVRLWRQRWQHWQDVALADRSVAERLTDAPPSGCPARITPQQGGRIVALACEPPRAGRPPPGARPAGSGTFGPVSRAAWRPPRRPRAGPSWSIPSTPIARRPGCAGSRPSPAWPPSTSARRASPASWPAATRGRRS